MSKTFIDFGIKSRNKKKIYETQNGDCYDDYMLSRYFKDIFNLQQVLKKKYFFNSKTVHDSKDIKFNFISYLLMRLSGINKFYEFGFTLYEKIYYFKIFNSFFLKKLPLSKTKFNGNDISEKFIFFSENFHQKYKLKISKKIIKKSYVNSIFFSKGVSLLYEKKNLYYLKNFIHHCKAGTFDISVCSKKKLIKLSTGYNLYYPSINDLAKLLKNKKKLLFFRNKIKVDNKIYLEILFGSKELCKRVNYLISNLKNNKKLKKIKKFLSFEEFKILKIDYLK